MAPNIIEYFQAEDFELAIWVDHFNNMLKFLDDKFKLNLY